MSITPEELRAQFEALKEAAQVRHERAMAELDRQVEFLTKLKSELDDDLWLTREGKDASFAVAYCKIVSPLVAV